MLHVLTKSQIFCFVSVDNVNNNTEEEDNLSTGDTNPMNGPHHHLHNDYEPVLSRGSYDLPPPDGADSQRRTVRKVAAGPPVASYKGTLLESPVWIHVYH